ncbi:MAG: hypothetical protein ACJZ47_02795, partial [bacterium]
MEDIEKKESKRFFPGDSTNVVPLMRDVFTIPTSSRKRPKLIGSFCKECEEHFFPKTGSKATCYYPSCPRSTTEVMFGEKGKILSANVTRVSMDSTQERVSAVIMLDEGIRINSHLIDWEGFRYLLIPDTPVELVLEKLNEDENGNSVVNYAYKLVTGNKKPRYEIPEVPVKRGRGRPRKHPIVELPEGAEAPVKRGRGRPRKHPIVELPEGAEAPVKRGRGRPRKHPIVELPEG